MMISYSPGANGDAAFKPFLIRLLQTEWDQPGGPLWVDADLTLIDVQNALHFQNTRILLRALADEKDGVPATAAGNLNRQFARRMFEAMHIPNVLRESTRHVCKVINEADVRDLQLLRHVCQRARFIVRREKRFRVTPPARALLTDDQAGALYRQLFLTFFRKLDLRSIFPFRQVVGIQNSMAIILWRLDLIARDWTPTRGLAEQVLVPPVLDELRAAMISDFDTEEFILAGYVLEPLLDFGLLERQTKSDWPGLDDKDAIRLTALWTRFLHFAPLT